MSGICTAPNRQWKAAQGGQDCRCQQADPPGVCGLQQAATLLGILCLALTFNTVHLDRPSTPDNRHLDRSGEISNRHPRENEISPLRGCATPVEMTELEAPSSRPKHPSSHSKHRSSRRPQTVILDRSGEISNLHPREYGISPLRFATVEMTNGLVSGSVEMNGWWRSLGAVISTEVERSLPECLRARDFSTALRSGRNDEWASFRLRSK